MLTLLFLLSALSAVFAGSPCPPREDIYPCSCVAIPQGRKLVLTIVTCHRLSDTDAFLTIFDNLRSMQIDQFYLYDSFWEANRLGTPVGENKQVLPADWLTLLRIKELEIVDTTLSSCFACHGILRCRNSVTTRFTAVNSSSSEKICSLCDTGRGDKYSWTGCMSNLQHFQFSHSGMTILRADFFDAPMPQLTLLNLTNNRITKIEYKALKNLPRLLSLDLSHNALQTIDQMFTGQMSLEFLDLSFNMIKYIGSDWFKSVPYLKTFNADNNLIVEMKESDWKSAPETLKNIYLRGNPIHCDCSIRWVNETFHVNVVLQGYCASPEEYENSPLRRASRFLNERCDENGNIGIRRRFKVTTPKQ